ncbi:MAG: hypothetical protein HDT50_07195 [Lactobacillus sp.]|nr:hypothetical protein [Lactobacillus sp.]
MDILLLFLGISFLILGMQFFRGKWLRLLAGNFWGDEQGKINSAGAIKAGKLLGPAVIVCGFSLTCLIFDGSSFWQILGIGLLTISGLKTENRRII